MALVPFENLLIPLKLYDHCCGPSQLSKQGTDFNLRPLWYRYYLPWYRYLARLQQGIAASNSIKDGYSVSLDVHHFGVDEIKVSAVDRSITVECKHEESADHHGYVSRHFVRRYVLPDEFDAQQVTCKLSSDGVLKLEAPRKTERCEKSAEVVITQTGVPAASSTESPEITAVPISTTPEEQAVEEANTCSCS